MSGVVIRHIRSTRSMTGTEVIEADPDPAPDDESVNANAE